MKDTDDMRECFDNLDVEIKLCKDCKHRKGLFVGECKLTLVQHINLDNGYVFDDLKLCFKCREDENSCGAAGKFFEQKQTLLERVKRWLN